MGEAGGTLRARFVGRRRPGSGTGGVSRHIHQDSPGHAVSLESINILGRDPSWFEGGVGGGLRPGARAGAGRGRGPVQPSTHLG